MAKKNDIIAAARKLAKIPIDEVQAISSKKKTDYLQQSVGFILTDLAANDNVLYKAMEKTYAEATSEISQVNPVMQRWLKQTGPNGEHSFGCFWDTTIPFVIYGGKVWNLAGGTLAADFKNAMTQYTAYLIGSEVSSGGASSLQRVKRSGKPATNLSAANATITAIKSGN